TGTTVICSPTGNPEDVNSVKCSVAQVEGTACDPDCEPHTDGCLAADSMVRLADQTLKKASSIEIGSVLWNPVTKKGVKVAQVTRNTMSQIMVTLETDKGNRIRATANHPFRTPNGDLRADELKKGDVVLTREGSAKIASLATALESHPAVVNFLLEPNS